jgi:hypothetical protein
MSPPRCLAALALLLGCSSPPPLANTPPDAGASAVVPDAAGVTPAPDAATEPDLALAPDAAGSTPDAAGSTPDLALPGDLASTLEPDGGGLLILDALKPPSDPIRPPPPFEALPPALDGPVVAANARLLVPGRARLVGTHLTACSNAVPASGNGDRWCAFSLPNRQIGLTDLWVIDVTKALAGTAITCDGSDPNCKLLIPPGGNAAQGTQLWTGQPMDGPIHPTTHRFDGDTLIFHALAPDTADAYSGPIFAWRPGWDAPKQISMGKTAYGCSAHFTAEVFVCIENLTSTMPLQFDLSAGQLASGAKLVKRITPFSAGSQSSQWRAALSPDGKSLAFSTGGLTIAERETLYVTRFDALSTLTTLKAGASRWAISADGTKVYFLANYNYDTTGSPSGTMTVMDFPGGGNERVLAPMVGAIQILSEAAVDKGVGFFDDVVAGKATYKLMKDPAAPTQVVTVISNIGGVRALSRDLRFLYYYKDFDMDNGSTTDGYVARTDGSQVSCALTSTLESDRFGSPFTPNGSMVFWVDNIDQIDGVGEGWMANPDGCTGRRKWADKVDFWFLHANDGMVFSDEGALDFSNLEVVTFPAGNTLGTPTPIQPHVNRIYGVLPDIKGLLFTVVDSPAATDGIYLYSKLPF